MEEYERRKRKSVIIGVILVLLVVTLGLGIIYRELVLDMYFKITTPRYKYSEKICEERRVFVDENLGISFDYPDDWSVRFDENEQDKTEIEIVGSDKVTITIFTEETQPREYLWALEDNDLDTSSKVDSRWRVEIGGEDGWGWQLFKWEGMGETASDGTYTIEVVTEYEGTMYRIAYSEMDVTQFDEGICYFEMIMQSLNFYD